VQLTRHAAHAAAALVALTASQASADSVKVVNYSYSVVWSAAIRLIRVDAGYEVRDRDKDSGYILFVFPGSGSVKRCAGSLELVRLAEGDGARGVRLQLSIAHQPSYIELQLLDKLEQKLEREQGRPPPPKHKRPPKPPKKSP